MYLNCAHLSDAALSSSLGELQKRGDNPSVHVAALIGSSYTMDGNVLGDKPEFMREWDRHHLLFS